MSRIYFFATGKDILLLLGQVEAKYCPKYVEENQLSGPTPKEWIAARDLPSLGIATGSQEIGCTPYLIMPNKAEVVVSKFLMPDGSLLYEVVQLANPDSILIRLGGIWEDGSLISGHAISSSDRDFPRKVIGFMRRRVQASFTKIGSVWVGPESLLLLRNGTRLCFAIQSPSEFDLREIADEPDTAVE